MIESPFHFFQTNANTTTTYPLQHEIQTTLFSEDVRNRTDVDGAVTAFLKSVTASKDAFAGLEDPDHKYVGAGAWFSATNRVYYAQLYGK